MHEKMTQYAARCRKLIDDSGWMVQGVFPSDTCPAFTYTAGLTIAGLPEVVIVGLAPRASAIFLNAMARRAMTDEPRPGGEWVIDDVQPGLRWRFGPVDQRWADTHVTALRRAYPGRELQISALQAVFPDRNGRYPGDAGYEIAPVLQPLLDDPDPQVWAL